MALVARLQEWHGGFPLTSRSYACAQDVLQRLPDAWPGPAAVSARHAAPPVALTSLAHGAGCGCKLPAAALLPIVRGLPAVDDERLLVGSNTADEDRKSTRLNSSHNR
jgi:hypothetical protein